MTRNKIVLSCIILLISVISASLFLFFTNRNKNEPETLQNNITGNIAVNTSESTFAVNTVNTEIKPTNLHSDSLTTAKVETPTSNNTPTPSYTPNPQSQQKAPGYEKVLVAQVPMKSLTDDDKYVHEKIIEGNNRYKEFISYWEKLPVNNEKIINNVDEKMTQEELNSFKNEISGKLEGFLYDIYMTKTDNKKLENKYSVYAEDFTSVTNEFVRNNMLTEELNDINLDTKLINLDDYGCATLYTTIFFVSNGVNRPYGMTSMSVFSSYLFRDKVISSILVDSDYKPEQGESLNSEYPYEVLSYSYNSSINNTYELVKEKRDSGPLSIDGYDIYEVLRYGMIGLKNSKSYFLRFIPGESAEDIKDLKYEVFGSGYDSILYNLSDVEAANTDVLTLRNGKTLSYYNSNDNKIIKTFVIDGNTTIKDFRFSSYHYGLFYEDGKQGLIDYAGNIILEPKYYNILYNDISRDEFSAQDESGWNVISIERSLDELLYRVYRVIK